MIAAALLAATLATTAFAGTTSVNQKAVRHLNTEFKNASNITWKSGDTYEKATLVWNNQNLEVFYNNNGEFLGVGKNVTVDVMPLIAQRTIQEKYKDYTITSVAEFNSAEGEINYYASAMKNNKATILKVTVGGDVSVYQKDAE